MTADKPFIHFVLEFLWNQALRQLVAIIKASEN